MSQKNKKHTSKSTVIFFLFKHRFVKYLQVHLSRKTLSEISPCPHYLLIHNSTVVNKTATELLDNNGTVPALPVAINLV